MAARLRFIEISNCFKKVHKDIRHISIVKCNLNLSLNKARRETSLMREFLRFG